MSSSIETLNLSLLIHKLFLEHCHISFYGASVTQQSKGYVPQLSELLVQEKMAQDYKITQVGFGSLHLKDATLLLGSTIIEIHKVTPIHICVLEWFTSETNIHTGDLHYIIERLLRENIL